MKENGPDQGFSIFNFKSVDQSMSIKKLNPNQRTNGSVNAHLRSGICDLC